MSKQSKKLRSFITIGMLSSISFILMLLNFPLPWFPAFLQIDFSDIPALVATIIMGPVAGITVELVKNVLDWIFSGAPTGVPVGQMANFATSILFILPTYFIYKKLKSSSKGLATGLVAGTISMAVGMSILNYVAFLPMYTYLLGWGTFDMYETIVLGILPFNIFKGVLIMAVMLLLYRTMHSWIAQQRKVFMA